jgi:hypothetical protein
MYQVLTISPRFYVRDRSHEQAISSFACMVSRGIAENLVASNRGPTPADVRWCPRRLPNQRPSRPIFTAKEPPVDDILFDAWTRRRFGLAAGGIAAAFASLAHPDPAPAKRKRCKKREKRCGGKCVKGTWCPGKRCGGDDFCRCGRTIGGRTICFQPIAALCKQCNGDVDCNSPLRCIRVGDCGAVSATCLPPCGAEQ